MGQIMSYIDVALPDELRNALSVLQTHAQPMPIEQVRAILRRELGGSDEIQPRSAWKADRLVSVAGSDLREDRSTAESRRRSTTQDSSREHNLTHQTAAKMGCERDNARWIW